MALAFGMYDSNTGQMHRDALYVLYALYALYAV